MPPGHIHWNVSALTKNQGTLADLMKQRVYQQFALPPSASWLGKEIPLKPEIVMRDGKAQWNLADPRFEGAMKWWFAQSYENGAWSGVRLLPFCQGASLEVLYGRIPHILLELTFHQLQSMESIVLPGRWRLRTRSRRL